MLTLFSLPQHRPYYLSFSFNEWLWNYVHLGYFEFFIVQTLSWQFWFSIFIKVYSNSFYGDWNLEITTDLIFFYDSPKQYCLSRYYPSKEYRQILLSLENLDSSFLVVGKNRTVSRKLSSETSSWEWRHE
jgi:hypothetical protein